MKKTSGKNPEQSPEITSNIPDYSYDAESLQKHLKKEKRRNSIILSVIAFIVAVVIIFINVDFGFNQTYIDGNILKIARTQGSTTVGVPWQNTSFVSQLLFRSLLNCDSDFTKTYGDLATGCTTSEDGLTYTLTLNENLKWSDGAPLTLDDVVYSIETALLCPSINVTISAAFEKIVGVDALKAGENTSLEGLSVDGNDLIITLESPYTNFIWALTQFVPMPKHIFENYTPKELVLSAEADPDKVAEMAKFYDSPVCSGMYMVELINEDEDLELIHNPYYVGEYSDIERVIMYGNYQQMYIDWHSTSNITEMTSYRSMSGFDEYEINVNFYRYFLFNLEAEYIPQDPIPATDEDGNILYDVDGEMIHTAAPPIEYGDDRPENTAMQNEQFRQAIVHAIDMESLIDTVHFNAGELVYGGVPTMANQKYPYDPEKAKELLIASGYDTSRPFTIAYYHSDATTKVFLDRVANYLQNIGLEVVLFKTAGGSALYVDRNYDMLLKALSAFNDHDWYNEYLSTNATISALFGTDEFDVLVDKLNSVNNETAYNETFEELIELEQELLYKVPLLTLDDRVYINANRLSLPDDMTFGNTRYRSDLRLSEWSIKKQ